MFSSLNSDTRKAVKAHNPSGGKEERKCNYTFVRGGNKSVWVPPAHENNCAWCYFAGGGGGWVGVGWGGSKGVQSILLTFTGQEFFKGLFPSEAFFQGWPEKQTKCRQIDFRISSEYTVAAHET